MALFSTWSLLSPPHGGQDRLAVEQFDDRIVLVVADGAGGMGGGAEAAQFICDRAMQCAKASPGNADAWEERLVAFDRELSVSAHGGHSAAVVAEVRNGRVSGASVGDSQAWLIDHEDNVLDLTTHRQRKPLLGSGAARPRAFGPVDMNRRRLLVATDGLFRYAPMDHFACMARVTPAPRAPSTLSDMARLPNGELQDDLAIVVCDEDADLPAVLRDIDAHLPHAQRGDPISCFHLAQHYENLDQPAAATHWFERAVEAGSTDACHGAGVAYARGLGVTQDYARANHYYRLGAERGCALALNNLGYHYEAGNRGLVQDLAQALVCYQRAAELGAADGQYNLAVAYQQGLFGLAPDLARAAALYRAAAVGGLPQALVAWGDCVEKGLGVAVDYDKAVASYNSAMNLGYAPGFWRSGLLHELGRGVPQDDGRAVRLYAEAAQHGCPEAMRCLGNMVRAGRGVGADPGLALHWLQRAAAAGDGEARAILGETVGQD